MGARDLRLWLEHAAESYGGDMPLTAPGALALPAAPPPDPPAGEGVAPVVPEPAGASRARATPLVGDPVVGGPGDGEPTDGEPADELVDAESTVAGVGSKVAPAPTDPAVALAELRARLGDCQRCKLCSTRKNVVFGEGDPRARVMFIGEAPGFHEDQQGRPFVGAAGQLLDRIIENGMGMRRQDVFIANVNKCRPPENREPEPDEVAACLPFLREQVRAIHPEVIVCLGRVASSNLLGTSLPMRALRGRDLTYEGIRVVATWHPAYLLRQPAAKVETWEDVKRVNRILGRPERPPGPPDRAGRGSPE
ncbi:MAG: uracil-DNA glycosylase family protein [Planctomycetota bacterium]